ncbi:bifunctional 4-hydroxy-2-oxoglutarate aldolase/2-dehydro-3-deoxy-phosphogluconate aldolase [Flavobacterium algicola]|uniref:bifunctional 4-hydroxy-2-oxoglutarate aldolase/2-dehydro-3-deoxy-phosphogluconate aldolase n=1 Tax=Flavobacterium algicola TaxID=556529 RepID=UPI001EFE0D90|nr:bifunctional 4-hydroxy-2-oxoglutarate aldolase/2-dehydro-3-deoxy-phosphogluconate aldolase [Flavobacterium algicola]MCG9793718.1 bifunctional 4-hydroxy-2-oxoglutarate aldolase/2-dehydro-3-deoxy-phosphogluconate aldolase [Flavobacterium algicola]
MKNNSGFSWELFNESPVVGIVRGIPLDVVLKVAAVYSDAGLSTIEITMNTEGATEIITALRKEFPNLNVGAGTVCTLADLDKAVNAGVQFIVTPIIDAAVIQKAVELNIPIFPGAYTPTEIYQAWHLGASAVKIFPATQLGTQFIKDVSAPLNEIKLLPTGGVSAENIDSFFKAGAVGVGMGSSLFDKKMIDNGDFEALKNHFIRVKNEIK